MTDTATAGLCAICVRSRPTTTLHLTHGVAVELCAAHADDQYVRRRGGAVLAERLRRIWSAHRILTRRRDAALRAHCRRVRLGPQRRDRPGSYSWPELRREAEARFAAGDDPVGVIAELRARHARGAAVAPTVRTMRRWFADGRWLDAAEAAAVRAADRTERTRRVMTALYESPYRPFLPYGYRPPRPPRPPGRRDE